MNGRLESAGSAAVLAHDRVKSVTPIETSLAAPGEAERD
jgi:hypothetical protein